MSDASEKNDEMNTAGYSQKRMFQMFIGLQGELFRILLIFLS